ncbi:GNAT family N-acetyltransferase [Curtobacterium sp. ISL-83]|uniref:GNAT family N-acetyltransferase n=1 Tax=Curtobacterium sp. ISL-83 TaxID=2819145 RepID=UPI002034CE85|nr:GNAT family N-acetyltransferase [Curtobacterium sp. ISL-83]
MILETERLRLRPWRTTDATLQHQLWTERDPRVPEHRRLTPAGHPTVEEFAERIRTGDHQPTPGLLVVEQRGSGTSIGYCGLIPNPLGHPEEPEIAYEFLQASWGHGYATEAANVVIERARTIGYRSLVATVRAWNTASFRVLEKVGFSDSGEREPDAVHGDSLLWRLVL